MRHCVRSGVITGDMIGGNGTMLMQSAGVKDVL